MIPILTRRWPLAAILALASWPVVADGADWKVADGPLLTKWSRDVRPAAPLPEYPRPQLVRSEWLNLNGLWQLGFGKDGEAPPVGKTLDQQILVPFPVESALSGVMKHSDRLWYRRMFTVPPAWAGRRILLHFGAVDWEIDRLGQRQGTGHPSRRLRWLPLRRHRCPQGRGRERADRPRLRPDRRRHPAPRQAGGNKPGGIFYTPTTGIWQTVWLEPVAARRRHRPAEGRHRPRQQARSRSRPRVVRRRGRDDRDGSRC